MRKAVGRNVLRKEGHEKVTGAARYIDDLSFPRTAARAHDSLDDSRRRDRRRSLRLRHDRLHDRRLSRHPRPQHRRADRRRSAVSGRADDSPRRRADSAARARGSRRLLAADVRIDYRAAHAQLRSRGVAARVQDDRDRQGRPRRGLRRGRPIVEGEYRVGPQEQLYIEPNGVIAVPAADDDGRRHHRLRLDAVSLLRASRADGAARPARRQRARRPDRNRRRLRRQGRVPVDDRRPRRARRAQGAAAGEARLRPRRGHAGDDEAASGRRSGTAPA